MRRSVRARTAAGLAMALASMLVAGCAGFTSDPALRLGVDAGLDRPVLVYVNDEWVGTFPGVTERDDIATGAHGGPPWRVEARTDAGRTLATFEVSSEADLPAGAASLTGCGALAIWAGDARPALPSPDPGAAPLGCD